MDGAKREILSAAKAAGLFDVARRRSAQAVRILCYHGVWMGDPVFPGDAMFMQAATFRRRLAFIREQGYPVVPLAAAVAALQGQGPQLPPSSIVITIDDGWLSTYREMLPALEAFGMPATLYCDTAQLSSGQPIAHVMARYMGLVAGATPIVARRGLIDVNAAAEARRAATNLTLAHNERMVAVNRLAVALDQDIRPTLDDRAFEYMSGTELHDAYGRGLDVQLHTHRHTLGDMSAAVIEDEIRCNRQSLAEILGRAPSEFRHFCYPSGITNWSAPQTLAQLGIEFSVTTFLGLAWSGADMQLLPRLHDGENVSDLEFEAELSGFGDWLRKGKRVAHRLLRRPTRLHASPSDMARHVSREPAQPARHRHAS